MNVYSPVNKHTGCTKHTNWCREQTQVLTYLQQIATMLRRHEENDYWQGQRSAEDKVTKKSACQLVLRFRQCNLPFELHDCEINAFRYGSRLCMFMFVWFTVQLYQRKSSGLVLFTPFPCMVQYLGFLLLLHLFQNWSDQCNFTCQIKAVWIWLKVFCEKLNTETNI